MILLDPDARLVVGHRGNRAHAPENTLEAFDQAVALGADAIEFDVRLSADGVPVVMHDPTIDRTTDGTGEVERLSLAELRAVDAGARFAGVGGTPSSYAGQGIRIPTLDEVLVRYPTLPLIIELKVAEVSLPVRALLRSHAAASRVIIDSFRDAALRPFAGTEFACGPGPAGVKRLYARSALPGGPPRVPFRAMCLPRRHGLLPLPVSRFARMVRGCGVPVHVWTVNEPTVARRLWMGGVAGIITDDPALMLAVRRGLCLGSALPTR